MYDVIIIGSGAAGLSAAVYVKRAGLSTLILEKMQQGAGQVTQSSQVDNYLGFLGISGYELGMKFREHVSKLDVDWKTGEAKRFEKERENWKVYLKSGEALKAKLIIYAAGARYRHLEAEGEEAFLGKGVSYCASCDGAFFKDKTTVVVGGGNTAMDDALYLSEFCNKVYLILRRKEFRGATDTLKKIRERANIEVITEARVTEIIGKTKVEEVLLDGGTHIKTDGIFIAVGMIPQSEELKGTIELDAYGYVVADESGRTSKEGFFVAGDVRTKTLRQIVTAVSDGANAANSAVEYLQGLN